jgi:hypothetical protein
MMRTTKDREVRKRAVTPAAGFLPPNTSAATPGPWATSKHATPEYAPQYGVYAEDGSNADLAIVKGENAKAAARRGADPRKAVPDTGETP